MRYFMEEHGGRRRQAELVICLIRHANAQSVREIVNEVAYHRNNGK